MKIESSALNEAMKKVMIITKRKAMMPILNKVRIEARDGKLICTCTDLQTWLELGLNCDGDLGAICVDPASLVTSGTGLVDISVDVGKVMIKTSASVSGAILFEASEFPLGNFDSGVLAGSGVIDMTGLNLAIAEIKSAVSTDATREHLCGINLSKDGEVVATDGHRLAKSQIAIPADIFADVSYMPEGAKKPIVYSCDTTLPTDSLRVLKSLAGSGTVERRCVGVDNTRLIFTVGADRVCIRTIAGEFPNYQRIIGQEVTGEVSFEVKPLRKFLDQIKTRFVKGGAEGVEITCNGHLQAKWYDLESGELQADFDLIKSGPVFVGSFNYRYLIDAMGKNKVVTLAVMCTPCQAVTPTKLTSPIKIIGVNSECVVMPMRL